MEKAQKSALARHIFSLTKKFAETITPPKGTERARALYDAIDGKFGCQETAVFDLVSAITGEDLRAHKGVKKVRPDNYTAFRVVTPKGDWKVSDILFTTACDDASVVGIRKANDIAHGAMPYRDPSSMVPATLKEIEAALSDELAQHIADRLHVIFL